MRCAANFEVNSEGSVITDDKVLTIRDPQETFVARIRNIARSEYTTPFVLSVHLYFDSPTLEEASDLADGHLSTCLNMLAFVTGCGFRKHRTKQIIDAETSPGKAVRDVRMWGEKIEYDDPQPFLGDDHMKSIERLLEFNIPPAIRRALRWYRLGIDAASPDDQFTYFWFALEIVAEYRKPVAKVNDKCPHCQSALYCESCGTHPQHRPYAKQAIKLLILEAEPQCDDATVALLDKTRNSLMHGATLREIEAELPDPHERVVDVLGRILWMALVKQFPKEFFQDSLAMGVPSTYVHYNANAIAHVQTVVPLESDGFFDLEFKGFKVEQTPFGPPQSAAPSLVLMSREQFDRLVTLSYRKTEHQQMLERIRQRAKLNGDDVRVLILATDMAVINSELQKAEPGEWQDILRECIQTAQLLI